MAILGGTAYPELLLENIDLLFYSSILRGMIFTQLPKRLFAWGMAANNVLEQARIQRSDQMTFPNLAELKRSLLSPLQGTLLEIGPGSGANFTYFSPDIRWIGVEPNPFMRPYLHQKATEQGFRNIELYQGFGEHLPVTNQSVDAVVSSHVLCSVHRLEQVLKEVQRVLKPGGQFIFLEHVAGDCGSGTRRLQDGIKPLWQALFDNCHPNREIWKTLEEAGFATLDYQHFRVRLPVVSPHIAGVATMPQSVGGER